MSDRDDPCSSVANIYFPNAVPAGRRAARLSLSQDANLSARSTERTLDCARRGARSAVIEARVSMHETSSDR